MAGYAAYPPETTRNVPKYFAPMFDAPRFTAKPVRHSTCPANANGERRWIRSDHTAQRMTVAAAGENEGAVSGWSGGG